MTFLLLTRYHGRICLREGGEPTTEEENPKVVLFHEELEAIDLVHEVPISGEKLVQIRELTKKGATLQEVIQLVRLGWSQTKQTVFAAVKPDHSFSEELTVYDGILFRNDRVVIPEAMQSETLQRIHGAHLGVNGCLRRARECTY